MRIKYNGDLPSVALHRKCQKSPWDSPFPSPPRPSQAPRNTDGTGDSHGDRLLLAVYRWVEGRFVPQSPLFTDRKRARPANASWCNTRSKTSFLLLVALLDDDCDPASQFNARAGHVPRQKATRTGAQLILHVVNPNVSRSTGKHTLDVEAQTRHYDLEWWAKDGVHYAKYRGWYLYEDDITAAELVRVWWWYDLVKNDWWYDDIIMPAFMKHDRK
ncbi:hypothetical protein BDW71DRAFT_210413 [Aspergillus fruticulosus]